MTGPRVRRALEGLPSYTPGRRPAADARGEGTQPYKLSSNENPYPPLPGVLAVATAAAEDMNRYPDMGCTQLLAALSDRLDVPVEDLATGTGSVGVLGSLLQCVAEAGDEVVYAWRSFEAYPIVVGISGATAVPVPLTAGERHDLPAMADAITERTRLVLVCSPNNPTGTVVGRAEMDSFLDRVPADVLVVLDEAYVEFVRDSTAADGLALYRERPNVAVLRTFSKAYGLAGLRVGYAVARAPVAGALRATAVPFGVSGIAQRTAVASLAAQDQLFHRVDALVEERSRVLTALRRQGWEVPTAEGNFVWLRLGDEATAFAEECRQDGVVVRPFAGEGCRITVGEPEACDLFLRAAARWRAAR